MRSYSIPHTRILNQELMSHGFTYLRSCTHIHTYTHVNTHTHTIMLPSLTYASKRCESILSPFRQETRRQQIHGHHSVRNTIKQRRLLLHITKDERKESDTVRFGQKSEPH